VNPTRDLGTGYYAVKREIYTAELEKVKESGSEYWELASVIVIFVGTAFL